MARWKVTARMGDGSLETKTVDAPASAEAAECEIELYFPGLEYIETMELL